MNTTKQTVTYFSSLTQHMNIGSWIIQKGLKRLHNTVRRLNYATELERVSVPLYPMR